MMSSFSKEKGESSQNSKQILEQLSKTGGFVFHGSPKRLDKLEPRQQIYFDQKTGNVEPDGEPAVCATLYYEIAIFRALSSPMVEPLGIKNYYTEFGLSEGKPFFRANSESIALARRPNAVGYVYVFSRKDFQPYNDLESRAYQEVEPLYTIEVKSSDLPENIEIVKGPLC